MPKSAVRAALLPLSLFGLAACGAPGSETPAPEIETAVPDLSAAHGLAMACSGCHSDVSGAIVSLDGYTEDALIIALQRYKSESDGTTVMHRLARGYSEDEIAQVSAFLAGKERAQ